MREIEIQVLAPIQSLQSRALTADEEHRPAETPVEPPAGADTGGHIGLCEFPERIDGYESRFDHFWFLPLKRQAPKDSLASLHGQRAEFSHLRPVHGVRQGRDPEE